MTWWFDNLPKLRAAGIPVDGIIRDNTWRAGGGTWGNSIFAFGPKRYPESKAFREWADKLGLIVEVDFHGRAGRPSRVRPEHGCAAIYVRAGAVIPMCEFALSSAFIPRDRIEVHVSAGADGEFSPYEDDRTTERYRQGEFSVTHLTWKDRTRRPEIGARDGQWPDAPARRRWMIVSHSLLHTTGNHGEPDTSARNRLESESTHALDRPAACLRRRCSLPADRREVAGKRNIQNPPRGSECADGTRPDTRPWGGNKSS